MKNTEIHSEDGRVEKEWEVRLKELCLSGDYPLIHELITNLLKENKQPIVNQSWEKEFDEKFDGVLERKVDMKMLAMSPITVFVAEGIKSFISQLLIDQKREWVEEKRKEVIKIIDLYGKAAFTLDAEIARHIVLLLKK